ncbi:hypothetical protein ACRYCC_12445 [Actinomadura scrupuli]|uniref:hypothetical protein n=1 Tax=Actinomadura scrupuli TaxID=559629 RepID=UPI003D985212
MVVVIAAAAVAVLAAVVVLALGRGGELAEVHPDHPVLRLPTGRPLVGTDVALLRLPRSLWGYHVGVTDEALRRMAYALTERDALVALLQQRLAELQEDSGAGSENGGPWFAPHAEDDPEPASWSPPAGFGHPEELPVHGAGRSLEKEYGPGPLREDTYGGAHEARGDTVSPEDR